MPRVVVAAPSTGSGKTTVATGLMAALRRRGLEVSGHKVGPDYIDPGYHALATGRPGRNLDPHLVGEERLVPLLLHGAGPLAHPARPAADVAVVEGVMGLFDGRLGTGGLASTAHVAAVTRSPVLLVVDVGRSSRTVAALVHGLATWDPAVTVAGVVLNGAGSDRNTREIAEAVRTGGPSGRGVPVVGVLPRDERVSAPSRHLGLVPVAERAESAAALEALADLVAAHVDLDTVLDLARTAPDLDAAPWAAAAEVRAPEHGVRRGSAPVVAVAGGRAFTFRYAETEELLRAAGCEPVAFDPASDTALPAGTAGLYLGGGFPEVHADALTDNATLRAAIADAVAAGVPTVAECAGLLYLAETLDERPMAGAVPARAAMGSRLTLAYDALEAAGDSLLTRAGEVVTAHEFHRTACTPEAPAAGSALGPAWLAPGPDGPRPVGWAGPTLHAAYPHVHWAGHPQLAQRFADAVHARAAAPGAGRLVTAVPPAPLVAQVPHLSAEFSGHKCRSPRSTGDSDSAPTGDSDSAPAGETGSPGTAPADPHSDPLRHHGDAETAPGLVDLAVNVSREPWPPWLREALLTGLEAATAYPDPTTARAALAAHHGRDPEEVLVTAGAAEAFGLLARHRPGGRPWRRPVVVHPQFTEPDVALAEAGLVAEHAVLRAGDGFTLDHRRVPEDADLVVVGNPTNPTGVLHPAATLRALVRPGRLLVVDEAFADHVPGEPESLAAARLPGVVVVRSLTKLWALPGVRVGHLLGPPDLVAALARAQAPWSVSSLAAAAAIACSTPQARAERDRRAALAQQHRDHLALALQRAGADVVPGAAPYVLARVGHGVHAALREAGFACRRADTFPGLDGAWVRVAAREPAVSDALAAALAPLVGRLTPPGGPVP
nr:cobyrinate a,c-diamide synthase [Nocardioides perillae]